MLISAKEGEKNILSTDGWQTYLTYHTLPVFHETSLSTTHHMPSAGWYCGPEVQFLLKPMKPVKIDSCCSFWVDVDSLAHITLTEGRLSCFFHCVCSHLWLTTFYCVLLTNMRHEALWDVASAKMTIICLVLVPLLLKVQCSQDFFYFVFSIWNVFEELWIL